MAGLRGCRFQGPVWLSCSEGGLPFLVAGEAERSVLAPKGTPVLLKVLLMVRAPGFTIVVDGRVIGREGVRLRVRD